MQRIDVHSRRQRFRKPLLQACAKSPSQVVGASLEKSSIARRKNHHSCNSCCSAQDACRSHKTVSPIRIENRPAQKSQNAVGLARAKNVGRPQQTRFKRRAKVFRRLRGHTRINALEQNLVARRRNSRESRESHSRLDGRSQRSRPRCLRESGRIRAGVARQNGWRPKNLGHCSRRSRQDTLALGVGLPRLRSRRRSRILRPSPRSPKQKQCHEEQRSFCRAFYSLQLKQCARKIVCKKNGYARNSPHRYFPLKKPGH